MTLFYSARALDGTVPGPVSILQRRFRLGYTQASQWVKASETAGILSPVIDSSGQRRLIKKRLP